MSLNEKIAAYKQKMAQLSPNTQLYNSYQLMIKEMEKELPRQAVILHVEKGPTCEGCQ